MIRITRGQNDEKRDGFFFIYTGAKVSSAIEKVFDYLRKAGLKVSYTSETGWEGVRNPNGMVDPSLGFQYVVHIAD